MNVWNWTFQIEVAAVWHARFLHNKSGRVLFSNSFRMYFLLSVIKLIGAFSTLLDTCSCSVLHFPSPCTEREWVMIEEWFFCFCFCLQETLIETLAKLGWKTFLQVKYCCYVWNSMMVLEGWWFLAEHWSLPESFSLHVICRWPWTLKIIDECGEIPDTMPAPLSLCLLRSVSVSLSLSVGLCCYITLTSSWWRWLRIEHYQCSFCFL